MNWYTSDQHYGHANIIKHCNRPFESVGEMDKFIIGQHNLLISKDDNVYHLGDFSFQRPERYLPHLNGKHHLIRGNHDRKNIDPDNFIWIKDVHIVNKFFLSHYAHRTWPRAHHGLLHLYGHSHGMLEGTERSMDVGVDTNSFKPYSEAELLKRLEDVK